MSNDSIPLLFSIDGSSRHEVLLVPLSSSLSDLTSQIQQLSSSSPNCEEFMAKYRKRGGEDKIAELKVRWSREGRDSKIWPSTTVLTDENLEAVLKMMGAVGVGRDVLEVRLEPTKKEGEGAGGEEKKE